MASNSTKTLILADSGGTLLLIDTHAVLATTSRLPRKDMNQQLTSLASGRVRDKSTNRSILVDASPHSAQRLTYAKEPDRGFSGNALRLSSSVSSPS